MNDRWRLYTIPILKEENYRWSDSWTSISDVGHMYHGRKFTFNDYCKTEQAYIRFITSLFEYLHAQKIKLIHLEVYDDDPPLPMCDKDGALKEWHNKIFNNMSLTIEDIQYVVPLILRENAWGTLYHKRTKTYIHFGYDYYVYVNSSRFYSYNDDKVYFNMEIERLVSKYGLFIEYEYSPELREIGHLIKEGRYNTQTQAVELKL